MSVYVEAIGARKVSYPDHRNVEFYSLNEYLTLAKKSISAFANRFYRGLSRQMLKDEDAIAVVANAMMMADWRYDENYKNQEQRGTKTRYSYRNQCAIWAIQGFVTKNYKNNKKSYKIFSLDHHNDEENSTAYTYIADTNAKDPVDIVSNDETILNNSKMIEDIMSLDFLTDKQKNILSMYYQEGKTFAKIAEEYGLTKEAIRLSIQKTIKQIRGYYNAEV